MNKNRLRPALKFALVLLSAAGPGYLATVHPASTPTARTPNLRSAAVLVKDMRSGELLVSKQASAAMPIASLTKLMTAMVVLDANLDLDSSITIEESDKDKLRNSHSHLLVGTRLTRREALLVALMASENRAARALGRTYPGGIAAMVAEMNNKARALMLGDTRFDDPAGLSEGNVSSAQDLVKLLEAAYRYPLICAYSTRPETTIQSGRKKLRYINTNALVRNQHWRIGLSKTGYIEKSGRCLVMQAQLAERPVLIVLLNSKGKDTRIGDANRIKKWLEKSPPPGRPPG